MSVPVTKNSEIHRDEGAGLSSADAEKRFHDFGPNRIAKQHEISFFGIAKQEVVEPMILLLLVVGVVYTVWGKLEDAITIFAVIAVLVFAEVWNEYRAKKAIASLSKLASPKTKLLRDGKITEVETEKVVPGDVLILAQGTRVAADGKLLESFGIIQVDESPLTGESLPVEKKKNDPIYAGTLVVSGEGKSVALATGKDTKIGQISTQVQEIKPPKTPLQLAMKSLAKKLVWVALFFSIGIPLFGFVFRGLGLREMVLTGLALAFATIPEELPIIITMNLGLGAYKLSKENFLVKKLKAAEVLGNATVILTDKTGTITENTMSVVQVFPENLESEILGAARGATTEISLSYTDKAIFERAEELKVDTMALGRLLRERNFGDGGGGRKTRSIVREAGGKPELFVIGAPEEMFKLCEVGRDSGFAKVLETETSKGRRVIAVARRKLRTSEQDMPFGRIEIGLKLLGLISIEDPPRKGVKETVESAMKAGVRTIMVTGDHPQTAVSIAKSVGITYNKVITGEELDKLSDEELREIVKEVCVFARTTPQHKYRLMESLRKNGEVVAVTGDGVNDALALKGADIGIAMGIKGTDVAKEAADIVLADDNYVTIGRGIFEGRRIFENLWKGVRYYLSVKMALVAIFLASLICNVAFPFPPIQIIVLELFMDLAASSGFVAEPPENVIYERPSGRKSKGESTTTLLDSRTIKEIAIRGLCLSVAVLVSYAYALEQGMPLPQAQTFAFSAWIIGHILLALVSRSEKEPLFKIGLFSNKAILIWSAAAFAFLLVTLVVVPASGVTLKLFPMRLDQLGLVFGICFVSIFWLELRKMFPLGKKATLHKE